MRKIKLGEIGNTLNGYAFDSEKFSDTTGFPIIRIRDLKKNTTATFYDGAYDERYVIKKGDLLIGMDGEFNLVEWKSSDALLNQRVCKLNITDREIDKTYVKYAVPKKLKEIEDKTPFVTVKHLSNKQILEIELPFPKLATQQKIASILSDADKALQLRKQANALTDQFLQSTFLDMFGDPVNNPKGWKVGYIGDLIEFMTSGSRGWAQYYSESGDVFLRINNVGYSELKTSDLIYVNTPDTAEAKRTLTKEGDVLFSITADLGRTAVIPKGFPKAYINQHLALLRLNKKNILPIFFTNFFATTAGRSQIINKGGVKLGLNFDDIKNLNVYLPPIKLQQQFADIVTETEQLRQRQRAHEQELDQLFEGLLQKYFG